MKKTPYFRPGAFAMFALTSVFLTLVTGAQAQTVIADSVADFSGVQGQNGWRYGYRNLTADGGLVVSYDPVNNFIEFTPAQFTGANWDLGANAPWTEVGASAVHPNGINNASEHWAIRRWTAEAPDITGPTLVQVNWSIAKTNNNGGNAAGGVTGRLHVNGETRGSATIAGNNTTGVASSNFVFLDVGDVIDLACTPVGPGGDTGDGSDGSATLMTITTVVDTEPDGLPDAWEEVFFPGDLTQLMTGGDKDGDFLLDEEELSAGSNPTLPDSDGDSLSDYDEVKVHRSNPNLADSDGDGISDPDEINGTPPTSPILADTDNDGFNDAVEKLYGSNPTLAGDTPQTFWLADSRRDFSGVQGQSGWNWGYRNFTADGGARDYNAASDFIPFNVDGTTVRSATNAWNGGGYAIFNGNPPWTSMANLNTHPNGTNNGNEHWTVRRWTASGLAAETPVAVIWHTRKGGAGSDGVTGSIHLNGAEVDTKTIAHNDVTGFIRFYYLNVNNGDIIDEILSPQGIGSRNDGNDGSLNYMSIDGRIPAVPRQPDGRYFIPVNAIDSEPDGLADFWEEVYFPGDLGQLASGSDKDGDGALDEEEQAASTNPTVADTDGDGRSDGDELHVAPVTDPYRPDTDGDGFSDGHELATGHDPSNANNTPRTGALADSVANFPAVGTASPQGVNGWTYGYYNTTRDGEPPSNTGFIPFVSNGTIALSDVNFWNGTVFDWANAAGAVNPPWTNISALGGHPNGDNNGDVHWATRRWVVNIPEPAPLALHYHVRKGGAGGNGTTAVILHNGEPLKSLTVGGADTTGLTSWYFVNAQPGDSLDVALTPRGTDDSNADGADSSNYWLVINPSVPVGAKQPDGTPFVPGTAVFELKILSVSYESILSDLTLEWTSRGGKEYQIEHSPDLINWTPIGPTIQPVAGGKTQYTLESAPESPQYYHVRELLP